ncbi:MAG TPA: hypothetical protein VGP02_14195 [Mycobacteriales bacterium]|jgi:hypothetical protein|nr:hypothetical protein [Mycobacteriales bacterium]
MRTPLRAVRDRWSARRHVAALVRRYADAVRDADEAGFALHLERIMLLGALEVEPRGPVSAGRRADLEIRQGTLSLEVMTCRHAANRARAALAIVRSPQFLRWYADTPGRPAGDVSVVSAFCAAHPADPGVLGLSVRTELVPAR